MSLSSSATTPDNFAELIARAATHFGDRVAIRARGQNTTFAALERRAGTLQRAFRDAGLRRGDRCAIFVREPVDAAAAFLAALANGSIGINVNELYRPRQIEHVLRNAGAAVLVASADALEQLPRKLITDARVLVTDSVTHADEFAPAAVGPREPAQITYTSGSTGQPKGVLMTHAALWAGVRIVAGYLGLRADDRIASLLPFSFVYGFNQLTTALYTGAMLVVERSTLANEIVATLRRERVSVVAAVPPLWQQLLGISAFRDQRLDDIRIMTSAGGRLPPAVVRDLRGAQPQAQLFLMYGLTEVFRSTYLPPTDVDANPESIGRAIPESTVYVVRENGELASPGEVGELVHGGPTMGEGYYRDPEATARVFRPNPFLRSGDEGPAQVVYSGDLVRRDAAGLLYHIGRRDRMIKSLGFRISPDEISDVILASGQVADAAIVTEPDPVRGERIVACIVLRERGTLEALTRFCRLELPRHMQPARFVVVAAIPRNASGKHDLLALREQVAASS